MAAERQVLISVSVLGHEEIEWSCIRSSAWILGNGVLTWEDDWIPKQILQRRVMTPSFQHPRIIWTMILVTGFIFSSPEKSGELDSTILVGPFQLEIFYVFLSWRCLITGLSVNNRQNKTQKAFIHFLLFTQKCKMYQSRVIKSNFFK